ncbi:MAG: hypothetical protein IJR14_05220, partial [Synergistaceae bacterium]|nr:hypothetical protein [Synergistaceae bacterium]
MMHVRRWAVIVALLASIAPAGAATFTVTHAGDGGAGSLRQAVLEANAQPGPHAISVTPGVGAIAVRSEITLTSDMTIEGNGATIEGNGTTRLFRITDGTATFERMTFTRGRAMSGNGGAVEVAGAGASAEFRNCTFFGNDASDAGGAVCITNGSQTRSTVFRHCTLAGNSATYGGGVAARSGTATFLCSIVAGNAGIPIPGGGSANADIWQDASGLVNGSWNVVGSTNAPSSFTSAQGTVTGVSVSDVFLKDPLELETVDSVQVLRLARTSPARDRIPSGTPDVLSIDQRGAPRPQMAAVDAGAFEPSPVAPISADISGPVYIVVGHSTSYDVAVWPEDASLDDRTYPNGVEWIVGDASIISIDAHGRATALRKGDTTVMAKIYGWDASGTATPIATRAISVRVDDVLPTLTVVFDPTPGDHAMTIDETATLAPRVKTTLNGAEVALPYALVATSDNVGVVSADVDASRNVRLHARAVG